MSKPRTAATVAAITAVLIVSACSKSETTGTGTTSPSATAGSSVTTGGPATTGGSGTTAGPATTGGRGSSSTTAAGGSSTSSGSTPSPAPNGPTPTYGENDTNITVATNGQFAIKLKSNASTGYTWKYKTDATNLRLVSETTEPPASGAIGAGGAQVFTFQATAPGTAVVIFAYARSTPSADDSTLRYTVTVS